mmetsp:Transcript_18965/g.47392  ORF Transcript_18965/g.47392 Transcript_18965/m.47392 type:complete len:234 (-) Transcript_18965:510-1211(-)
MMSYRCSLTNSLSSSAGVHPELSLQPQTSVSDPPALRIPENSNSRKGHPYCLSQIMWRMKLKFFAWNRQWRTFSPRPFRCSRLLFACPTLQATMGSNRWRSSRVPRRMCAAVGSARSLSVKKTCEPLKSTWVAVGFLSGASSAVVVSAVGSISEQTSFIFSPCSSTSPALPPGPLMIRTLVAPITAEPVAKSVRITKAFSAPTSSNGSTLLGQEDRKPSVASLDAKCATCSFP